MQSPDVVMHIHSRDRRAGTTIADAVYDVAGSFEAKAVQVAGAQMYNSFYAINERNNTFVVNNKTFDIPLGNVATGDAFATILQNRLRTELADVGLVVTYDSYRNTLTFLPVLVPLAYDSVLSTTNELISVWGEDAVDPTKVPLVESGQLNLGPLMYVKIHSSALSHTNNRDVKSHHTTVIESLPLSTIATGMQEHRNHMLFDRIRFNAPRRISSIDISMRDTFGRLLDPNGVEHSLVLKFWTQ